MTVNAQPHWTPPRNEPARAYLPGDSDTKSLMAKYQELSAQTIEVPAIINGQEIFSGDIYERPTPHNHGHICAKIHQTSPAMVQQAIDGALEAWKEWSQTDIHTRLSVFRRIAELAATKYRDVLNASTMVGQSKTIHQAEIESACELIDFFRFNVHFAMTDVYANQPHSPEGIWDYMDWRPLEGFVFAVTPFNFTAIGANLPTAPAMMGCVSLWKPTESATLANYYTMKMFEEAGLPPGVIQFLPGDGPTIGGAAIPHPEMSGLHFTGSLPTFRLLYKQVAENFENYRNFPRVVGETGGKDFIFAHNTADVDAMVAASVRGAYEYQGQKCSALSRMYVPKSIWADFRDKFVAETKKVRFGDPGDTSNFGCAVIDQKAFDKISGYLDYVKQNPDKATILQGGGVDGSKGWFIEPTIIEAKDPHFKTMEEEIFGPVVTCYVYDDDKFDETLDIANNTSPYALTGAIWARDRYVLRHMSNKLRWAAGNFYINDKPTGSIVNNQPFGGSRASGTNDKAGASTNLYRWVTARSVKETLAPTYDWRYPWMS